MAVQFDKLRDEIRKLGEVAVQRQRDFDDQLADLLNLLGAIGDDRDLVVDSVAFGRENGYIKDRDYRGAVPLPTGDAVNEGIDVSEDRPDRATIIAVDGSQAVPSRHDVYQYYLLNMGWIVYRLGRDVAPDSDSQPHLHYPGDEHGSKDADFQYVRVTIERDMLEIGTLAKQTFENRMADAPILSIMDQRLQYWPIGLNDASQSNRYVQRWLKEMETIKRLNALLIGYIERPETGAIITMANTVGVKDFGIEVDLNKRPPFSDTALYRRILRPGQRSCVFQVENNAAQYEPFKEANQEICFFYFNPPGNGDITRVDMPKWVAQQEDVVAQIHGILYEQCVKLGGYPYVLTRADEQAVVRSDDKNYLEQQILREMDRQGMNRMATSKQIGKDLTRTAKRRR